LRNDSRVEGFCSAVIAVESKGADYSVQSTLAVMSVRLFFLSGDLVYGSMLSRTIINNARCFVLLHYPQKEEFDDSRRISSKRNVVR
jgi:hypothetical protein